MAKGCAINKLQTSKTVNDWILITKAVVLIAKDSTMNFKQTNP